MISKLYRDNVTADEIGRWNLYDHRVSTCMEKWIVYNMAALLIALGLGLTKSNLGVSITLFIGGTSFALLIATYIVAIFSKNIVFLRAGQKQISIRNRKRSTKYKIIRSVVKILDFILWLPATAFTVVLILMVAYNFKTFWACSMLTLSTLLIMAELAGKNNWIALRKSLVSKQELEAARKLSPDKFEDVSKLVDFFVMTGDYEEADHYSRKLLSMAQALPVTADKAESRELCA